MTHSFHTRRSSDLLEAYNLLSGRSIYKEIFREKKEDKQNLETERPDKTSIWMKLNMDVTEAYGYHPVQRFYPEYRSEEHTSELQSLMRTSYAVFSLNKKTTPTLNIYNLYLN